MADAQALMVQRRQAFEIQLQKVAPRLAQLLPPRAGDPSRFIRQVGMAVLKQPALLAEDVDRASLVLAILTLAEMGLGPGPLAFLVPFRGPGGKKYVTPIPGYQGLIDVAIASGKVSVVNAGCVYQHDNFRYREGTEPLLQHEPLWCATEQERGPFMLAYAIAWPTTLGGGRPWTTVMQRHEIEVIRNGSKGYQFALKNGADSPWLESKKPGEFRPSTPSAAMAIKTCVRRLYKLLPKTSEMILAERATDDADALTQPDADASINELLGLVAPPADDKAERTALLTKLIQLQQREPKLFADAAVSLNIDPKAKLEGMDVSGLTILWDEIEANRSIGGG